MTEARWARLSGVFRQAIELPAGAARDSWLDQTCAGDTALRRNVQRLLDAYDEPTVGAPAVRLENLQLAPGDSLAQYRIEALIGHGGMGVVYRAFDTRLQRTVALKVLPLLLADGTQRLLREARAASALNHPNIVTVYEAGEDQDLDFIAMEYIEGVPLGERIGAQGLPVAELVQYAVQIAEAVSAAHAARILHRDIKPSNLMLTGDGRVKVLDFGIARVMEPGAEPDQTLTGQGVVRGTPAYMSPEQAEGRKLDSRSDIFSFGCVLYQMATGCRPFEGDSNLSVMYGIVNQVPRRPTEIVGLPSDLERLILRCLEKDPAARFQSMNEVKTALEALDTKARPKRSAPALLVRRLSIAAATVAVLAAAGWIATRPRNPAAPLRTVKFAITPSNLLRGGSGEVDSEVSVSRDGKHIAYVESQGGRLWIRDIDSEKARPVPGTADVYQVFWSPDNQWIGYSSGKGCGILPGCDLMKIPVEGGTPRRITRLAGSFKRAAWSSDGRIIVYCDSLGMYTVPAEGGTPTRTVEHNHIEHPSLLDLPGGRRAFLFQALDAEQPSHAIYIQVAGEKRRRLVKVSQSTNPYPTWSPTGHIVYVDGPNIRPEIWALPYSLRDLKATGNAFRIVANGASPMVSASGTLVYGDTPSSQVQLSWVDRSGKVLSKLGAPRVQSGVLVSPDASKVAVIVRDPDFDIYVFDADSGRQTRLTSDARMEAFGAWNPAGSELTYASFTTRETSFYSRSTDNSPKELLRTKEAARLPDLSPNGNVLMYTVMNRDNKGDLAYRERLPDGTFGEQKFYLRTPAHEGAARFSPNGRRVAFISDQSGRREIHVADFPVPGDPVRVSSNGGAFPRWRGDGRELYYSEGGKLMAVRTGESPRVLFEKRSLGPLLFDCTPDGKRFAVLDKPGPDPPLSIHVVQNWFEEFR